MAATPYPIPRELRQTGVLVGSGATTYGPFAFKCFDIDDVQVWVKRTGQTGFTAVAATVAKVDGFPLDFFRVTVTPALTAADRFVVAGMRLGERSVGIKAGTRLDVAALEKELSKVVVTEQELRRDIGRSLSVEFGQTPPTLVSGIANGASLMKDGNFIRGGPNPETEAGAWRDAVAAEADARIAADNAERDLRIAADNAEAQARAQADAIETAARIAADNAIASLVGQGGPIEVPWYDSVAAFSFALVKGTVQSVLVDGARYKRVASAPSFGGLQSGDGAWWGVADNIVEPRWFGILGDGSDETVKIQALVAWAAAEKRTVLWDNKTYIFSEIYVRQNDINVIWRSKGRTVFRSNKAAPATEKPSVSSYEADAFIDFITNSFRSIVSTVGLSAGGAYLTVDSTADVVENDTLVSVNTSRVIETDNRGEARHGWTVPVDRVVNATTLQLARPIPVSSKIGDVTGVAVVSVSGNNVVVSGLGAYSRTDAMYRLRFNTVGGLASDVVRYPEDFDVTTQAYRFNISNGPVPVGLQAGDSITVERRIDIGLLYSAKVDIGPGFILERAPHTGAVPGDLGFRGLRISRGLAPKIEKMGVRNFSEAGIVIASSYAADVSKIAVEGCNRAYDGAGGTGYGVSCFQSSWGVFEDIFGFGCRRVLDFHGTQQASYHNVARNVQGYGGGTAYDGVRFWPAGATECSVVGSHGAAWYTRYVECRGFNVTNVVALRGYDEYVGAVYGAGSILSLVASFLGDGAVIDGMYFTDGLPDWVTDGKARYGYFAGGKLYAALSINASNIIKTKPHMLSNLHLRGVKRAIIDIRDAGTVGPIVISGAIDIMTDNEDGDYGTFDFIRPTDAGTKTLSGPVIISKVNLLNSPLSPKATINFVNLNGFTVSSYWRYGNQYHFNIPNNGVMKIPCGRVGTTKMSLKFLARDRSPVVHLNNAEVWLERAGDKAQVPNSLNVDILDTVLTGTTGAPGKVSVSYGPSSENAIYIENRYGTAQGFIFECDAAL